MTTNRDNIFIVTRLYISASDSNSNGHSDCEVFQNRDEASRLFRIWREEELNLRKETGCDYNILTDKNEKFHCSWDSNLEMLIVILTEKVLKA